MTGNLSQRINAFLLDHPNDTCASALHLLEEAKSELAQLTADRDAAWRVANAASEGHTAIRTRYFDLAEKIGATETDSPSDIAHRLTVFVDRQTRGVEDALRSSERELDAARDQIRALEGGRGKANTMPRSVLDPLRARGVLGPGLVDKAAPERVVTMVLERLDANRREIERLAAANRSLAQAVEGQKVNRQKYAKAQLDAENFGQIVQHNDIVIAEANARIDEMKQALATGARERERLQWSIGNLRAVFRAVAGPVISYKDVSVHKMTFEQLLQRAQQLADDTKQNIEYHSGEFIVMAAPGKRSTPVTSTPPEVVDVSLGDNRDAVKQGAHVWVRRPSARWDETAAWKLERRPEGSTAQLHPELDAGSANLIADAPGTYIVSGTWREERATSVISVDIHISDESTVAEPVDELDELGEHRKTLVNLHSTLAVADKMRAALLMAGAPVKGDLMVWASNVRNTIVGLKRDLHEAGKRFLAADSARRSELDEFHAACANLPFQIAPRDTTPISLLLALRDAAVRFHKAPVNPADPAAVSGA